MWIEFLKKIITGVLNAFYQPLLFAIVLTVFVLIAFLYSETIGWKKIVLQLITRLKSEQQFLQLTMLVFYTVLILFRTLFSRSYWANPTSNVIGVWGLYNEKGEFTTEIIENALFFLPFSFLYLLRVSRWQKQHNKKQNSFLILMKESGCVSFLFSFSIEALQLVLRIGTFQLSDLFFNTVGGIIGGFIFWLASVLRKNKLK